VGGALRINEGVARKSELRLNGVLGSSHWIVVGGGDPAIALVRLPAYHLHVDVGEERVRVLAPLPYALLQAFDSACVGPPVVGDGLA
jgi:hypothetical protein